MRFIDILCELTHIQIQELLIESFGEKNKKFHTLDEISLNRLLTKIPKTKCNNCGKEFIANVEGYKIIDKLCYCLDCYWNDNIESTK